MGRGVRYRHIMARTRGSKQPDVVVGVSCDSKLVPVEGRPNVERLRLVRWFAAIRVPQEESRTSRIDSAGSSATGFLGMIERLGARYRHILIVSVDAVTDWCLLGVWEALEDERIRVIGAAGRDGTGDQVGYDSHAAGFVVTEDPPSILYAYLREGGALLRWVDTRNYGVASRKPGSVGAENARATAEFAVEMIRVLTERELGALKDTAGAQALYSFRYKHLEHLIVCHTVGQVLDMEKEAYYSGRCECGRIGYTEGPVYELDVRGSYCHTCVYEHLPLRLRHYQLSTASGEMPDLGGERGFIGTVCIETDEAAYPVRRNAVTVFPTGRFVTTLCGPELMDAVERGRVKKWLAWAEYDMAPALSGYASEVYDIRCCAESICAAPLASWAKAMAVSIVGKLGQRGRNWQWLPGKAPRYCYDQYYARHTDGKVHRFQEIAGAHRMECIEGWGVDSVPAVAAWVCSAARLRLLELLRCARTAECWYTDTDCLFVTNVGYRRLAEAGWVRRGELGYLQLKGCHDWFEPRGIKSYRLPHRNTESGLRQHADGSASPDRAHRHNVWVSSYLGIGARPQAERVISKWERLKPYLHGQITAGGRVIPLHLWEE
jgi:hypothetical protein